MRLGWRSEMFWLSKMQAESLYFVVHVRYRKVMQYATRIW